MKKVSLDGADMLHVNECDISTCELLNTKDASSRAPGLSVSSPDFVDSFKLVRYPATCLSHSLNTQFFLQQACSCRAGND